MSFSSQFLTETADILAALDASATEAVARGVAGVREQGGCLSSLESVVPPATLAEMSLLAGVEDACARLKGAVFLLIVATNQPDIARGRTTSRQVDALNRALQARLGLDEVCVCPNDDVDECHGRKPKPDPELITNAGRRWNIDLVRRVLIGHRENVLQ
jgi:histidinol phosphatase-like enzyme